MLIQFSYKVEPFLKQNPTPVNYYNKLSDNEAPSTYTCIKVLPTILNFMGLYFRQILPQKFLKQDIKL